MTADTAIFLQVALENSNLLNPSVLSDGNWRIFSKLGAGYSTTRERGEIVSIAYGCLPPVIREDGSGHDGLQISIACRGSVANDVTLVKAQAAVKSSIEEAISFISSSY